MPWLFNHLTLAGATWSNFFGWVFLLAPDFIPARKREICEYKQIYAQRFAVKSSIFHQISCVKPHGSAPFLIRTCLKACLWFILKAPKIDLLLSNTSPARENFQENSRIISWHQTVAPYVSSLENYQWIKQVFQKAGQSQGNELVSNLSVGMGPIYASSLIMSRCLGPWAVGHFTFTKMPLAI